LIFRPAASFDAMSSSHRSRATGDDELRLIDPVPDPGAVVDDGIASF
jgi:hypothetical protein